MKLSSRKQLIKEANEELRQIRTVSSTLNETGVEGWHQKKDLDKLKKYSSIVDAELVSAVTELRDYKKIMSGLIKKIETTGPLNRSEMATTLKQFWMFSGKKSSLNKVLNTIQEFGEKLQELQKRGE